MQEQPMSVCGKNEVFYLIRLTLPNFYIREFYQKIYVSETHSKSDTFQSISNLEISARLDDKKYVKL